MALHEFKRAFNAINLLLTILSLLVAFVFYKKAEGRREIVYYVSRLSTVYNSRASPPKIKVLDASAKPIAGNIYLMTFAFWNSGNLPIEHADMRTPIEIVFEPCDRILDYSILNQSDPAITQFKLREVAVEGAPRARAIQLTWQHFDPKEGIRFQVLFAGDNDSVAKWGGKFAGAGKFVSGKRYSEKRGAAPLLLVIGLWLAAAIAVVVAQLIWQDTKGKKRFVFLTILLLIIGIGSSMIYAALNASVPAPFDLSTSPDHHQG
jgi:hypothetical protein